MSEPADQPTVNDHGYPDATPVAEMTHEHQAAYWRHHARKHEQRASAAPTADELTQLRADAAELATRKAAELSETDRLKAEKEAAEQAAAQARADAATATRRALLLEVASTKGLTPTQAERLQGSTREALEADADALRTAFGGTGDQGRRPPLGAGSDAGTDAKTTAAGAARYAARHGKS
ncbi:hypothetical protein [Kitasatospora sp. NPDC101183]|uniref:hypothetical protein n=1 Tax=Kitasatospora sp. NPDC101183 TaxID=3364100 RepID=UPI0038273F47